MAKPHLSLIEAEELYREALDETGPVEVSGMKYDVSHVLKSVDPIAYRCGFNDFADSLTDEYVIEDVNDDDDDDEDEDEDDES